ncbi:MAG: N-acetyl-D-Glu racemase DgcA [Marinibacterium sp.]
MPIDVTKDVFPLARAFTISRGSRMQAEVLTVRIRDGAYQGQGECTPYARYGETCSSVADQIRSLPPDISLDSLQDTLPPGAARNAVDCALWDLAAKRAGTRVWDLIASMPPPHPVVTAYTLSLDTPERMRDQAVQHAHRPILKIKLGTHDDLPRLKAVRAGAPASRIIIDANEGWTPDIYADLAPRLADLGVEMIEQPLPAGKDAALAELPRPVPVCADESCHDRASLPALAGKYDMINVKLGKTGGLSEALALTQAARAQGFSIMVGCMIGSSLAMAPALLLAQQADIVDLDAPLLLARDRVPAIFYDDQGAHPPNAGLWG